MKMALSVLIVLGCLGAGTGTLSAATYYVNNKAGSDENGFFATSCG